MAVRVVVSGTRLYFVQCLPTLIWNLKHYRRMLLQTSKTRQGVGEGSLLWLETNSI